jgi:hypothetical protein
MGVLIDIIYFIPLLIHIVLLVLFYTTSRMTDTILNLLYITAFITAMGLFLVGDLLEIILGLIWVVSGIGWRKNTRMRGARVWI